MKGEFIKEMTSQACSEMPEFDISKINKIRGLVVIEHGICEVEIMKTWRTPNNNYVSVPSK